MNIFRMNEIPTRVGSALDCSFITPSVLGLIASFSNYPLYIYLSNYFFVCKYKPSQSSRKKELEN